MELESCDIDAFRLQLERAFREFTIEPEVLSPYTLLTLAIAGAPDEITVLFEQNAVIQAGWFTTEASYTWNSFKPVIRELERMAREGYHARRTFIGTLSRFGPATTPHRALTSAPPWPGALAADA